MDFSFTDEQRLLKESVERLLTDRYGFEARQGFVDEPTGWSRTLWRSYAELGLLGLPFEEQHGGIGGGPVETMIVMEAFGRALALEPFPCCPPGSPAARRASACRQAKTALLTCRFRDRSASFGVMPSASFLS